MTMSPEERRRRMHKALERSGGARSARSRGSNPDAEITDYSFDADEFQLKKNIQNNTKQEGPDIRLDAGEQKAEKPQRKVKRKPQRMKSTASFDMRKLIIAGAAVVIVFVLAFAVKALMGASGKSSADNKVNESLSPEDAETAESLSEEAESTALVNDFERARLMYAQYDYDAAEELLKSLPDYESNTEAQELVAKCEETKATLVEQDIYKITHVFFHILCVDPKNSFDESKWGKQAGGYNSLMTTISEFEKMIQEMYDKGFVLVSIRDIAHEETASDGSKKMVKGSIMLPPGKQAFVMSEDDVCYYEYMKGAGFADKMIIGDDGRPTLHYTDADGNESVGDYDIVPILDKFIDEHPDFSYKGHKACLVFTGYNGVLGYRTDESYDPNSEYYDPKLEQGHDIEAERKEAVKVMKALLDDGYDLGSHSWGHRDLGQIEFERFKKDCDRWNRNVAPLIKEASGKQPDIIIYPRGADIADWHGYPDDNQRFNYLYDLGFRYYCNVDNNQYWVQLGDRYLRQGRRALDGLNMWLQISGQRERLDDLFDDVNAIFDPARPTPVPNY
ncbi:MAG: polysaccharide deacetylase [Eubacteriales bacterium]|nr:polysaccharide deacetylase [Eubacteriales bacterium]